MDKDKIALDLDLETASALAVILTGALETYHRKHKETTGALGGFYRETWQDVTAVRDEIRQQIRRAFQEGSDAS